MNYHPPTPLFNQRTILVTGASDGIGREAALNYAKYGARLIIMGRTTSKLEQVQREMNTFNNLPNISIVFDFLTAKPQEYQTLAKQLSQQVTHLDGLLHSAGLLGEITPIAQQDIELWQQIMQVNVNAQFMLTQALLPLLLKSPHASLIFTSSSVGRQGRSGWGAYAVSKFATEGLMQILADEYRNSSLRVNCINPGGTRTAMRAAAFPDEDANKLKTPAELMSTYLYLMSDDSRGVSGQSFDAQPDRKTGPAE